MTTGADEERRPRQELSELRARVEQLEQERDKALSARDVLVQQVLAVTGPPREEGRRRRGAVWLVALVLVMGLLFLALKMMRMQRQRRAALQVPVSMGRTPGVCPERAPTKGAGCPRRLATIPITEVDLVTAAALSPGGEQVAVGGLDGTVVVHDLGRGRTSWLLRAHRGSGGPGQPGGVRALRFAGGGSLFSGGADGAVHRWNLGTGARSATPRGRGAPVRSLALCGGRWLAVAAEQPEVELIALSRREAGGDRKLRGHEGWVRALSCSADGKLLASGGDDGKIRLWSPAGARLVRTLPGHGLWVSALSFSPDGKHLASGGFDRRIRLWEVATGKLSRKLWGHVRYLTALAFDRGGKLLVTGSADRTARVWRTADWSSSAHLTGHRRGLVAVAALPDGQAVLSASSDGTVRLWPHPLPRPRASVPLPPPGPGELTLRSYTAGERLRVRVLDEKGRVLEQGRQRLAWILRSSTDDRVALPRPELVKLLYRVAERFGREREITVISGFRSPEYNALRTRQSKQVGKESRHMKGEAIDIRIEGVAITRLHRYVLSLKAGGVGFYADSQFVHMDIGPVRRWSGD